ncbi:MAG: PKD domain-containing protein, partial [Thermoplasmata archaeon]|nr:PKD domain-containing protein [Thermoplasmata archaeon]
VEYYSVDKAGNVEQMNSVSFNIDNDRPVPDIVAEADALVGEDVVLDGMGSSDNYGIQSYEWKIEKNGELVGTLTGEIQSWNFEESGTYRVTLMVTDYVGNTNETSVLIDVTVQENDVLPWDWILIFSLPIIIFLLILVALLFRRRRKKDVEDPYYNF